VCGCPNPLGRAMTKETFARFVDVSASIQTESLFSRA
jgi:hypothetical protein